MLSSRSTFCRTIADSLWEDHDIERHFGGSDVGGLLLSRRAELRDMLENISQRVVLIQQPKKAGRISNEHTIAFATAASRDEVIRLYHSPRRASGCLIRENFESSRKVSCAIFSADETWKLFFSRYKRGQLIFSNPCSTAL